MMKLTTKIVLSAVTAALLFSGCTSKSSEVKPKNDYLDSKAAQENLDRIVAMGHDVKSEPQKEIERYFNINIGDTSKTIFERLSLLTNKVYIVDDNDFRAKFVAPGMRNLEDVVSFYQANGIKIVLSDVEQSKYAKVAFTNMGLSEVEKRLSSFQVKASGTMPIGAFLQDIASKANLSIIYTDKSAKNISTVSRNVSISTDGLNALKQIGNSSDLDIKVTEKNIEVAYFKTEVLKLDIFSRDRNIANHISNSTVSDGTSTIGGTASGTSTTSSSSSTSDSGKDLEIRFVTTLVKELETSVESLLSPHGSFKMMPSAGQIVVRDKIENVKSIQKTINDFNAQFKDTLELTLTFYKVTTQKGDKRGLDFKALNGKLAASSTGMITSAGFNGTTGIASALGLGYTSNSTSALFNLLSEYGTAEVINPVEIVTQSNMLKTVKIANNFGYIASIDTTTNTNAGTTASIEPSSVPDGMFFSLLAKPLDNNYIAVDVYATNNSFVKFNTATAFGSTVQTPDTSEQSVDGYHQLKNGIPQILVSHKYQESKMSEAGLPIEFLKSMGYQEDSNKDVYIVITLEANLR